MKAKELKPIGSAIGLIDKIQTQRDGGFRITIDLPETELGLIQELLKIKSNPHEEKLLYVSFVKASENDSSAR